MIKWGFLVLTLCFSLSASAQKNQFDVAGRIINAVSGEPIENANVLIQNSFTGTSTNELGEFKLSYNSLPLSLEITHISFKEKILRYEFHPLGDLQIALEPAVEELSQITISSQRIDTLYADEEYSIIDYELVEEGILLLVFKARLTNSALVLLDDKNKPKLELNVLPGKPLALICDCLGNIQLILKDKIAQINITENQLFLLNPYSHEEYKKVMSGCLFMIGKKIYFEEFARNYLAKRLFYIDTTDRSNHLMAEIADQEKLEFLRDNPENNGVFFSEGAGIENLRGLPGDAGDLEAIRNLDVTARFNKMAYLSDIYAPAFKLGDSVCIFNHPENQIEIYNTDDSLVMQTKISYHLVKHNNPLTTLSHSFAKPTKWEEKVFIDEKRRVAYALFKNINGTRDLKEIDLITGSTRFVTSIPYPFVEKIKIDDGYLYYLYRGWGQYQTKKLFRQRIY